MKTTHISNQRTKVSRDFAMSEFYFGANPLQEWDCPQPLIDAAQVIRDWIGVPLIVSSTYRNPDKYGRGSAHEKGLAVDMYSKQVDVVSKYNDEITSYLNGTGSRLIEDLRAVGIDGFGIEGGCIHLDCGGYGLTRRYVNIDKYGKWSCFIWNPAKGINKSLKSSWTYTK